MEMNNAFDGLISRLDVAEQRIAYWSLKICQKNLTKWKSKEKKRLKKKGREYPRNVGQLQKEISHGEQRGTEVIHEVIMAKNLLKLLTDTKP